ncbi:hypothetical protein HYX14_02210 [Candidatus Woesearchaeota archaeon]|nr:hypothetical protein [Candidatus Woesearchaeota archaeon]
MGWFFKKKVVPKVPMPPAMGESALRLPPKFSSERVIEPEKVKAAAGLPVEREIASPELSLPMPPTPGGGTIPDSIYVKVEVYQQILGEVDSLRKQLGLLTEAGKVLETSEYNEEANFTRLRRAMKMLHDDLLKIDKVLFK